LIIKFDGCYHGHADSFLVKAGSGVATLGISSSPGAPEEITKLTLSIPFNDVAALEKAFEKHGDKTAAVIIEPIVGNCGLILPVDDYLTTVRELCTKHGALLIFDEVMTGFRVALGGAQEMYKIKPDLTCLGKIIGGGVPVGAYGGRKDIMEMVAPQGPVYQAGTLSGNPLAMAAGIAQLKTLQNTNAYAHIAQSTKRLADGLTEAAKEAKKNVQVVSVPGMLTFFMSSSPVKNFEDAQKCDTEKFGKMWKSMLDKGVYWPPSQFEAAFMSTMHHKIDIDATIKAFADSL
jgi:glutamate-1-semialdehyde 2,1-aminomutase